MIKMSEEINYDLECFVCGHHNTYHTKGINIKSIDGRSIFIDYESTIRICEECGSDISG